MLLSSLFCAVGATPGFSLTEWMKTQEPTSLEGTKGAHLRTVWTSPPPMVMNDVHAPLIAMGDDGEDTAVPCHSTYSTVSLSCLCLPSAFVEAVSTEPAISNNYL